MFTKTKKKGVHCVSKCSGFFLLHVHFNVHQIKHIGIAKMSSLQDENESDTLPPGFLDYENLGDATGRCKANQGKLVDDWPQKQATCMAQTAEAEKQCSNPDLEDLLDRAARLGVVPVGTDSHICKKVVAAEQLECLAKNSSCPEGTLPDLPNNPHCCVPIVELYRRAKTLAELEDILDRQTQLDDDVKQKLLEDAKIGFEKQRQFTSQLPDMNNTEKAFVQQIADKIAQRLQAALELAQLESRRKLANASTESTWRKTMSAISGFFVTAAKYTFNAIAWILSHPVMAMWITQLALRVKKKICRELSMAFGFGGGEKIKVDLLTVIKKRAKKFYNENWEAVVLSVVYKFVNGIGFDWLTNGISAGLSYALSGATAVLATIPGVGWAGATVLYGVSYLASSGIKDILKETLREAAIVGTTALVMQKTGNNFIELISGECLQTQPNEYVWMGMSWFGENK